jgi:hypothetical protein
VPLQAAHLTCGNASLGLDFFIKIQAPKNGILPLSQSDTNALGALGGDEFNANVFKGAANGNNDFNP